MQPIIEIQQLAKRYRIGGSTPLHSSFREAFVQAFRRPLKALRSGEQAEQRGSGDSFWALKNISLDVQPGDTVGIIGPNGAGKSTLLKILSRITDPTEGQVIVRGTMASLLEVGTGFHPELTGRENIYLNGSILGMSKKEIESKFDQIAAFSGISKFLDTPVKRYSSGMYVRLAFAIAAHLEPEILVIDEVLAVGDVAFQKKCLGKMAEACTQNRTVLFVSHNFAAVEGLCNKGVVLQHGRLVFSGSAKGAVSHYLQSLSGEGLASTNHVVDLRGAVGRSPMCRPLLRQLELYSNEAPLRGELPLGAPVRAVIQFELEDPCTSFDAWIAFYTLSGQRICTAHSAYEPNRVHEERSGEQTFVCDIPALPLTPGEYKVNVGIDIAGSEVDWVDDAARITVIKSDFYGTGIVPIKGTFLIANRWALASNVEEVAAV
jgi:lipopolysaccharide transport system ATP-binding protein